MYLEKEVGGRHSRTKDRLERKDRLETERAWGIKIKSAMGDEHYLGPTPMLGPGDVDGARAFLERIRSTIAHGGWTRMEHAKLTRMRKKWEGRAAGTDQWFNRNGNRWTHKKIAKAKVTKDADSAT